MEITTIVFVVAMVLGLTSGRVTLLGVRGEYTRPLIIFGPLGRSIFGAASSLILFSLFVWGFASLSWYWPIIAFMIGTAICATVVQQATWPALYSIQPALDLVVIGLGLYLWIWQWPF